MLPESPFLQLVPGRVQQLMGRVRSQIWHGETPLTIEIPKYTINMAKEGKR